MALRVLHIDDDPTIHEQVAAALCPEIVEEVIWARSPGDGIRCALHEPPDLILLDVNMPVMDGFKVCGLLKEDARTRDVPILFITVDRNVVHLARALACGAADWIRKPVNPIELQARVKVALRQKELVDLLKDQARIDALTGLNNRVVLDEALASVASAWERKQTPSALLLVDLDHFKLVNDEHGHGVGDEMLRAASAAIRACCRPYDTPCRYGGDEFAVVLNHVEGQDAIRAATRVHESLAQATVRAGDVSLPVVTSAGLATTTGLPRSFAPGDLVRRADEALYAAKNAGRGQLVWESASDPTA